MEGPGHAARALALVEVVACSDFPTQLALSGALSALGLRAFDAHGHLSFAYVVTLSLADAALLIGLMVMFLWLRGERARDVFMGSRPRLPEAVAGLPLTLGAIVIGATVMGLARTFAPWTHTVERNPLEDVLASGAHAWTFALVVILAGGVREELQRAFLLHRFEQDLGGGPFGVVVTSAAFGAGHLLQGVDAALATAALGAWWGVIYLRRRSALAPIVSHSGFDLLQIVQFVTLGR